MVMNTPRKLGWLMQESNFGYIDFYMEVLSTQFNRQEFPDYFLSNGAVNIAPVSVAKKKGSCASNTLPFIMGDDVSVCIDSEKDMEKAIEVFLPQGAT